MALHLSNYRFCVTNYTFSYPEKSDQIYKDTHDPEKVSLKGFVICPDGKKISCYLRDDFPNFGFSKSDLESKLNSDCIIDGSGLCKLDWQYNYKLELTSYTFSSYYQIKITTINDGK